jgi:hypothetical protein
MSRWDVAQLIIVIQTGIISIGPAFIIDLFAELDATTATLDLFSTGVAMNVPGDAIAVLNFADASQNELYDWTPVFTPLIPQPNFDGEISLSASAGIEWRVEFDILVVGEGLSAGLALEAPAIGITLTGTGDVLSKDACDVQGAEFGVGLEVDLFAELDVFAGFGAASDLPNKQPLLSTSLELFSTCLVVASAGPSAPAIPSAVPSAPSNIPSALVSSVYASSHPSGSAAPSTSSAAPSEPYASSPSGGASSIPQYPSTTSAAASSYQASSKSYAAGSASASAAAGSSSVTVVYVTETVAVYASSASGW